MKKEMEQYPSDKELATEQNWLVNCVQAGINNGERLKEIVKRARNGEDLSSLSTQFERHVSSRGRVWFMYCECKEFWTLFAPMDGNLLTVREINEQYSALTDELELLSIGFLHDPDHGFYGGDN